MADSDFIQKDLGLVTAYGYALAGGYQGTEEQFKQDFAALISGQYNSLVNKPQINGHTLVGNKTSEELGISSSSSINNVKLEGDQTSGDLHLADGNQFGDAIRTNEILVVYRDENETVQSGYIGNQHAKDQSIDINGIGIRIKADTDFIDFSAMDNGKMSMKLFYVSPNADETWCSQNGLTRNTWYFNADVDMRNHKILNANIVNG